MRSPYRNPLLAVSVADVDPADAQRLEEVVLEAVAGAVRVGLDAGSVDDVIARLELAPSRPGERDRGVPRHRVPAAALRRRSVPGPRAGRRPRAAGTRARERTSARGLPPCAPRRQPASRVRRPAPGRRSRAPDDGDGDRVVGGRNREAHRPRPRRHPRARPNASRRRPRTSTRTAVWSPRTASRCWRPPRRTSRPSAASRSTSTSSRPTGSRTCGCGSTRRTSPTTRFRTSACSPKPCVVTRGGAHHASPRSTSVCTRACTQAPTRPSCGSRSAAGTLTRDQHALAAMAAHVLDPSPHGDLDRLAAERASALESGIMNNAQVHLRRLAGAALRRSSAIDDEVEGARPAALPEALRPGRRPPTTSPRSPSASSHAIASRSASPAPTPARCSAPWTTSSRPSRTARRRSEHRAIAVRESAPDRRTHRAAARRVHVRSARDRRSRRPGRPGDRRPRRN